MVTAVGIIGTGFGQTVHLPAFQHHNKFEVISIAGRNEEKAMKIAQTAGIEHTTNWQNFLTDPRIVCDYSNNTSAFTL